ncbi:MAG TPA: Reeler domain-containing protein [Candidatus Wunengus sp. YC63]|uniref:Reeler domain-containing protein n=1 Tax=Candidatus Wunengus sp. YC63 TaxID=3367699 RepID=UPI0027134FF7|nr:Reeler domain-containing protein [Candidatus Brocadiales bacterium]
MGKYFILILIVVLWSKMAFGFSVGPPAERTGNPGEICGDDTCASTCHTSFPVNSGTAKFSVGLSSASYKPGQTLDITITFSNTSTAIHGFEITAVDATNNKVGTFAAKDDKTQTESYDNLYAAHTKIGTAENQWTVQWTAPAASVSSPIAFYAAGNEANGNSTISGDYIYTDTATISLTDECIPSTIKIKPKKLVMKRGKSAVVTITVKGENKEPCTNHVVYASAANKKVSIDESTETNDKGKAKFTVTAGNEKGKDVITFSTQDDNTEIKKDMNVIVK